MAISKKEIQYIADLARLDLSQKEIEKMKKELSLILDYFNLLKEVDVSDIEASFYSINMFENLPIENVTREDCVRGSKKTKELMKLARGTKENFVKIKSVFNK